MPMSSSATASSSFHQDYEIVGGSPKCLFPFTSGISYHLPPRDSSSSCSSTPALPHSSTSLTSLPNAGTGSTFPCSPLSCSTTASGRSSGSKDIRGGRRPRKKKVDPHRRKATRRSSWDSPLHDGKGQSTTTVPTTLHPMDNRHEVMVSHSRTFASSPTGTTLPIVRGSAFPEVSQELLSHEGPSQHPFGESFPSLSPSPKTSSLVQGTNTSPPSITTIREGVDGVRSERKGAPPSATVSFPSSRSFLPSSERNPSSCHNGKGVNTMPELSSTMSAPPAPTRTSTAPSDSHSYPMDSASRMEQEKSRSTYYGGRQTPLFQNLGVRRTARGEGTSSMPLASPHPSSSAFLVEEQEEKTDNVPQKLYCASSWRLPARSMDECSSGHPRHEHGSGLPCAEVIETQRHTQSCHEAHTQEEYTEEGTRPLTSLFSSLVAPFSSCSPLATPTISTPTASSLFLASPNQEVHSIPKSAAPNHRQGRADDVEEEHPLPILCDKEEKEWKMGLLTIARTGEEKEHTHYLSSSSSSPFTSETVSVLKKEHPAGSATDHSSVDSRRALSSTFPPPPPPSSVPSSSLRDELPGHGVPHLFSDPASSFPHPHSHQPRMIPWPKPILSHGSHHDCVDLHHLRGTRAQHNRRHEHKNEIETQLQMGWEDEEGEGEGELHGSHASMQSGKEAQSSTIVHSMASQSRSLYPSPNSIPVSESADTSVFSHPPITSHSTSMTQTATGMKSGSNITTASTSNASSIDSSGKHPFHHATTITRTTTTTVSGQRLSSWDRHRHRGAMESSVSSEPPSRILDFLYLGTVKDATDLQTLQHYHITTILNISEEEYWCPDRNIVVHPFPIHDVATADISSLFVSTRRLLDKARAHYFKVKERTRTLAELHSTEEENPEEEDHLTNGKVKEEEGDIVALDRGIANRDGCGRKQVRDISGEIGTSLSSIITSEIATMPKERKERKTGVRHSAPPCILVHCQKGQSRSATIVCAYLIYRNGWSVDYALRYMRSIRSCVAPNIGFLHSLRMLQEEVFGHEQRNGRAQELSVVVKNIPVLYSDDDQVASEEEEKNTSGEENQSKLESRRMRRRINSVNTPTMRRSVSDDGQEGYPYEKVLAEYHGGSLHSEERDRGDEVGPAPPGQDLMKRWKQREQRKYRQMEEKVFQFFSEHAGMVRDVAIHRRRGRPLTFLPPCDSTDLSTHVVSSEHHGIESKEEGHREEGVVDSKEEKKHAVNQRNKEEEMETERKEVEMREQEGSTRIFPRSEGVTRKHPSGSSTSRLSKEVEKNKKEETEESPEVLLTDAGHCGSYASLLSPSPDVLHSRPSSPEMIMRMKENGERRRMACTSIATTDEERKKNSGSSGSLQSSSCMAMSHTTTVPILSSDASFLSVLPLLEEKEEEEESTNKAPTCSLPLPTIPIHPSEGVHFAMEEEAGGLVGWTSLPTTPSPQLTDTSCSASLATSVSTTKAPSPPPSTTMSTTLCVVHFVCRESVAAAEALSVSSPSLLRDLFWGYSREHHFLGEENETEGNTGTGHKNIKVKATAKIHRAQQQKPLKKRGRIMFPF